MGNKIVGIIRDENGSLENMMQKSSTDFIHKTELGETVVYSFFQEFEVVPSCSELFEQMLEKVTEKMLAKGISVKGFIFTKNNVVIISEEDSTAYIVDWPSADNMEKITVLTTSEDDDEYGNDDEYDAGDLESGGINNSDADNE